MHLSDTQTIDFWKPGKIYSIKVRITSMRIGACIKHDFS